MALGTVAKEQALIKLLREKRKETRFSFPASGLINIPHKLN